MNYWLVKSEPEAYSIDQLEADGSTHWDGIRNYQARNYIRDEMQAGDMVLFYHSNSSPPGVAGLAKVCKEAYPDHTAFDESSKYHDPKSNPENPTWLMMDLEFVAKFPNYVPLEDLKCHPALQDMLVVQKGQRLSVQPVDEDDFAEVVDLGGLKLE